MGTGNDGDMGRLHSGLKAVLEGMERLTDAARRIICKGREAEERQARLAAIVEHSADAMISLSMDGTIMTWNRGAERLYGYNAAEAIGKNIALILPQPRHPEAGRLIDAIRKGRSISIHDTVHMRRDGSPVDISLTVSPIKDVEGEVSGISLVAQDISELRQAEEALKKSYGEMERQVRERTSQLSIIIESLNVEIATRKRAEEKLEEAKAHAELYVDLMGHDINNMNQAILGFIEIAMDRLESAGSLGIEDGQLLASSMEAARNSSKLIDNVKKLQMEKAGEFKPMRVDVGDILRKVKAEHSRVEGRDVAINYRQEAACKAIANELLYDVFSNIVGNAVKHSKGALVIDISLSRVTMPEGAYCRVTVEDTGPGIPDERKQKVFERIGKGRMEGKGLGLYLARTLVDDYHGKIWMEDRVPHDYAKGVRVVVLLPSME
jgi:PAS domain S-box-containing protein